MTLEELYQKFRTYRTETSNAFAAVKMMIDGLAGRVARIEALEERIRQLEERLRQLELEHARQDGVAEVTGRFLLPGAAAPGEAKKDGAHKDVEVAEKHLHAERWKSSGIIVAALIAGIFGTITSLISLVSRALGGND